VKVENHYNYYGLRCKREMFYSIVVHYSWIGGISRLFMFIFM